MSGNEYVKNAALLSGGVHIPRGNSPDVLFTKQRQYYSAESDIFRQKYARYAGDYFEVQVQGLDTENPYGWTDTLIRMSDIAEMTAASTHRTDDVKEVLFANPAVTYIPQGAKIRCMGSTWLVTNPANISGGGASAVVQRCNAVWNRLDYYGNIVPEPIVIDNSPARTADNDEQLHTLITRGFYTAKAQYNEATKQLAQNARIMLGSKAYAVRGYTDFLREFTDKPQSVRMVEFYLYYEEPNGEIDDIENSVAGGKNFSWNVNVAGPNTVAAGQIVRFSAQSLRCGLPVTGSEEHPINYVWESENPSVASVDEFGNVTAHSEGQTSISCTLAQNPAYRAVRSLRVEGSLKSGIAISETPAKSLGLFESTAMTVSCHGAEPETRETAQWSFSGAAEDTYSAEIEGNRAVIRCWRPSAKALKVTASWNGQSVSTEILLLGN